MTTNPRRVWLLGGLLAVLVAVLFFILRGPSTPSVSGGGAPRRPVSRVPKRPAEPAGVVDVNLARLDAPGPTPGETGRNPFRMGAASRPSTEAGPPPTEPAAPVVPAGPPPPPPLPPIPYKFIGIVTAEGRVGRIAVLSDGRAVVHGREGDVVDGRFRIVQIGVESIQIEYADGRGRQTIRLTGS